jgi:hypothetical protein
LAAALALGCSGPKPAIDADQLKDELTTCISLASEAGLVAHAIASEKLGKTFAQQHSEYLGDKVKKELDEMQRRAPAPPAEAAYRRTVRSLEEVQNAVRELTERPSPAELIKLANELQQEANQFRALQDSL